MQLEADIGSKVAAAELEAARGHAFTLCRDEVQVGDPCTLNRSGLGGDAQIKVARLLLPLVDKCHGVGQDYASLILKDADCSRPRVRIQLAAGVLGEPVKTIRVDMQHGHEDIGLNYNPNATPVFGGAGHLGHDMMRHRGMATEYGAQGCELLRV